VNCQSLFLSWTDADDGVWHLLRQEWVAIDASSANLSIPTEAPKAFLRVTHFFFRMLITRDCNKGRFPQFLIERGLSPVLLGLPSYERCSQKTLPTPSAIACMRYF
jgi:hypothetical protein